MCNKKLLEKVAQCSSWGTGLSNELLVAYADTFSATPAPPVMDGTTTNAAAITSTGAFTPVTANDGFVALTLDTETKVVDFSTVQDSNGAVTTTITGRLHASPSALGFARKIQTKSQLLMAATRKEGQKMLYGRQGFPCVVTQWDIKDASKEAYIDFTVVLQDRGFVLDSAVTVPLKTA